MKRSEGEREGVGTGLRMRGMKIQENNRRTARGKFVNEMGLKEKRMELVMDEG